MFDLRTAKRVFYLVAMTEEDMNKWVECICSVCGLKMETIPNELVALLPPMVELAEERYSPQPSQAEQQQTNLTFGNQKVKMVMFKLLIHVHASMSENVC